jgi:hypothetical protein
MGRRIRRMLRLTSEQRIERVARIVNRRAKVKALLQLRRA